MRENGKSIYLKLAIVSVMIVLMGSFWLSASENVEPVSIVTMPVVPREGEPVLATFKLSNPLPQVLPTSYQFYANGKLLTEGDTSIPAGSCEIHQYAYENPLQTGEQLNFVIRSQSEQGNYEKVLSLPSYTPQVWSSFISFASFSTSVMSSMSTMTYYKSTFGEDVGLNIGIVICLVLLVLLILLELTRPVAEGRALATLGRLRLRFSTVTWLLLIIFLAMVYTRVVMILIT